jgi:hypothetical protein
MKYISFWRLFLKTKDKEKAAQIVKKFIEDNPLFCLHGDIKFVEYWKNKSINAELYCIHKAKTWENACYEFMQCVQRSSYSSIITGSIEEDIDIFSNDIRKYKNEIESLNTILRKQIINETSAEINKPK